MTSEILQPVRYLFVVGTPGVGKSTVCRELEVLLTARGYQVDCVGDYPYLRALFQSDERQGIKGRFKADLAGEFEVIDPAIYDEALKLLYDEQLSKTEESRQRLVHIVEFSRPAYDTSFAYYPLKILMNSIVVHIIAPIEVCRFRNDGRRQALEDKLRGVQNRRTVFDEDPDLHYVPEAVMSKYYAKDEHEDQERLSLQERALSNLPFRSYIELNNSEDDREAFVKLTRGIINRTVVPRVERPESFAAYYERRIVCMLRLKAHVYVKEETKPPDEEFYNEPISTDDFFDVFLAHNHADKPDVETVHRELQRRGLKPWLDKEEIRPGSLFADVIERAIHNVKAAAIFIGPAGLGRWQAMELRAFIDKCVEHNIPVIPVLLPGIEEIPSELHFLKQLHGVSFQEHVEESLPLEQLHWGITGHRLNPPMA